jgi:hypothetical protein
MDTNQLVWIVLMTPILTVYSIKEINRGLRILKHNENSLSYAIKTQIKLMQVLKGRKYAESYREKLLNDPKHMKQEAFNSILGGVIMLAVCIFWALLVFNVITNK